MKYKGYQISWWLILLELLLIVGVSYFADFIAENLSLSKSSIELLSGFLTLIPIIIGIFFIKRTFLNASLPDMLGFRGFDATMLLFFIVMPFSAQYFASLVTSPATFILTKIFGEYDPGIKAPQNIDELFGLIMSACIIAPVFEELLFRGVIMKLLSPYGFLVATVSSSVGFAMLHFSPESFFILMFLGFILALIRYISGSVFACMIFHAFCNLYSVISLVFEEQLLNLEQEIFIFILGSAFIFPFLLLFYKKLYPCAEKYIPSAKSLGFSMGLLLNILIFAVFCVRLALNNL